jgi:glycosyltransferase involved in cell wall biosynthesis
MPSGEVRWQHWSDRAIFDGNGKVIEYQSVGRDITAERNADAQLKLMFEELNSAYEQLTATEEELRQNYDELEKSQMVARHLGISDAVEFLGPRYGAAKAAVLSEGWCMALPSYAEVFPLALLEGYAAGLPVVSTRVGGIPDFVQEGENGLLVEPGDQQGLAAALTRLLTETPLRCRMAEANRRVARERYDIDICAQRVREIYQELLRQ